MLKVFALIDCDSFFVSCEQAENPELKEKPVCVTGGPGGCILSRSKKAKELKIPMGYPLFKAKREFKDCIYVDARPELYIDYSKKIMSILKPTLVLVATRS